MSEKSRGCYIVGEGGDGTGKSTQIELLAGHFRDDLGVETYVMHEPDGSPISSEIRKIIKNGDLQRDPMTNLLLFTAARRATWFAEAMPVLDNGGVVLSARNYISTEVYQGKAEGLDIGLIQNLTRVCMNDRYLNPDLAVVFDIPNKVRQERIAMRGELENPDTFEARGDEFQEKLDAGYREIAQQRGLPIIDASRSIEDIQVEFRDLAHKTIDNK